MRPNARVQVRAVGRTGAEPVAIRVAIQAFNRNDFLRSRARQLQRMLASTVAIWNCEPPHEEHVVAVGAILSEPITEKPGRDRLVDTFETFPAIETSQMTERNAVALPSRQLCDERRQQARPHSLALKAGCDVHAPEHENSALVGSSHEANRLTLRFGDVHPIGERDSRVISHRAVKLHERRIFGGCRDGDLYLKHKCGC